MQVAAANGVASTVSVVDRDVGLLQRGMEVRAQGVNIVVTDMFDAGTDPQLTNLDAKASPARISLRLMLKQL